MPESRSESGSLLERDIAQFLSAISNELCALTSLQQRLVKTGGRLIKHGRYYWLLLAESHLTRRLFAGMLRKITALPVPAG
jgi:hypothetical protein